MCNIDQSTTIPHECPLELLESELQRDILLEATTPIQILNLIKASPRFHQVFLLNKEFILSTIARRQLHPAVFPEALTFATMSQFEQPCSRITAMMFCEINPSNSHDWQKAVTTIPESIALCKFTSNLKFFVEDYARNTLPIMAGLGKSTNISVESEYWPERPVSYSELSETEIGRLQRAFCRFEIYRHLFAQCSANLDHSIRKCASQPAVRPAEQASLYLGKFPDYQVAEIDCIRDYLIRRLRGICTELENEAVATLSHERFVFDREGDAETDQWSSGVFLFTKDGKQAQEGHLEHLMSLGLPYIRRIFESTGDERRALFVRDIGSCLIQRINPWSFLTKALDCLGRNPAWENLLLPSEAESPCVLEATSDMELDIPAAWPWANPRRPPVMLHNHNSKGLRDWGYVFWDFDRLDRSGILERESNDVLVNKFDELGASRSPSVQERLLKPLSIWYLGADWESPEEEEWEDWSEEMYSRQPDN